MGILFHDIECVAEFVGEFRLGCADGHRAILPGGSIGVLKGFFHSEGAEGVNRWEIPVESR